MLSFIRRQMSATNLIAVAALIFAMAGGAFAATGGSKAGNARVASHATKKRKVNKGVLITSTKQLSKRVIEALNGKEGKGGPAGPAGAAGKDGVNGTNGTNGQDGTSVTATTFTGEEGGCLEGGVKLVSASGSSYLCNGTEGRAGKEGKEGALGTAGATLPSKASETGTWAFETKAKVDQVPISFTIPLAAGLASGHADVIGAGGKELTYNILKSVVEEAAGTPADCPGSVAAPTATPGNLCIYVEHTLGASMGSNLVLPPTFNGTFDLTATGGSTGTIGARMAVVNSNGEGEASGWGSWAVTAE